MSHMNVYNMIHQLILALSVYVAALFNPFCIILEPHKTNQVSYDARLSLGYPGDSSYSLTLDFIIEVLCCIVVQYRCIKCF